MFMEKISNSGYPRKSNHLIPRHQCKIAASIRVQKTRARQPRGAAARE